MDMGGVKAKVVHRLGKKGAKGRPLIARLKQPSMKYDIYDKAREKLKGSKIYINDQKPMELDEMKRRERQVHKANKELTHSQRTPMHFEEGTLIVNGKPYMKKVGKVQCQRVIHTGF